MYFQHPTQTIFNVPMAPALHEQTAPRQQVVRSGKAHVDLYLSVVFTPGFGHANVLENAPGTVWPPTSPCRRYPVDYDALVARSLATLLRLQSITETPNRVILALDGRQSVVVKEKWTLSEAAWRNSSYS
jgi:hypothetical protein